MDNTRILAIEQRLKDSEPCADWKTQEPRDEFRGDRIDIYGGNTKIASVYNRWDAELLVNAPDDLKWAIATIQNLDIVRNALHMEIEQLKAKNDELWRMVGDKTGNA